MFPATIESLVNRYERNALIRGLIQLIPLNIGSALDTAVLIKVQAIRAERAKEFFDELSRGEQELKPDLLESNEFLHCFFATSEAALKTNRAEKIRMFARLLRSSTDDGKFSGIDEYEEFLGILNELTYRELALLTLLDNYETRFPKTGPGENEINRAMRFWKEFCDELVTAFGIKDIEIDAVLHRLNRSGCYETFTNDLHYFKHKGKTTPTFQRLKSLALDEKHK